MAKILDGWRWQVDVLERGKSRLLFSWLFSTGLSLPALGRGSERRFLRQLARKGGPFMSPSSSECLVFVCGARVGRRPSPSLGRFCYLTRWCCMHFSSSLVSNRNPSLLYFPPPFLLYKERPQISAFPTCLPLHSRKRGIFVDL